MKLSQFNPAPETAKFCPILHPTQRRPIISDGVECGFELISANSKQANTLRRQMQADLIAQKHNLCIELGKPEPVNLTPTADEEDALAEWEAANADEISSKMAEFTHAVNNKYLAAIVVEIRGDLELDDGIAVTLDNLHVLFERETWVAAQVSRFHNDLDNWLPKLQDS